MPTVTRERGSFGVVLFEFDILGVIRKQTLTHYEWVWQGGCIMYIHWSISLLSTWSFPLLTSCWLAFSLYKETHNMVVYQLVSYTYITSSPLSHTHTTEPLTGSHICFLDDHSLPPCFVCLLIMAAWEQQPHWSHPWTSHTSPTLSHTYTSYTNLSYTPYWSHSGFKFGP